jgi:hypothetical protein
MIVLNTHHIQSFRKKSPVRLPSANQTCGKVHHGSFDDSPSSSYLHIWSSYRNWCDSPTYFLCFSMWFPWISHSCPIFSHDFHIKTSMFPRGLKPAKGPTRSRRPRQSHPRRRWWAERLRHELRWSKEKIMWLDKL